MGPEVLLRIAAIAGCVLSGVLLLRRGLATATAWWLLACALVIALARLPQTSPATVYATSLVAAALVPACASAAGLYWPARSLTRTDRAVAAGALVVAGVGSGLIPALVSDPRAAGCNVCPGSPLGIAAAPGFAAVLTTTSAVLTVGWGATLAVIAVIAWAGAPRLVRRHAWPMLMGGAAVGTLAAAAAAHALMLAPGVFDVFVRPARIAELAVLLLMSVGIWFRLTLPRRMRGRVARAILSATPTSISLVDSLAHALGDPGLRVTYNRLDGSRIDVQGRPAPALDDRATLRLTRDGSSYAEIWYSTRLRNTADLVGAVATTSGLALEHLAAQARLRAEALDATAARQRIVVRADAERKRLERDLHDGAQQGLITLSMQLTAAAAAAPDRNTAARLQTAQGEFAAALYDLRAIARGLFPVSLAEAGVHAALRELGDHTHVPLVVEGSIAGPCVPETNMAIYHLVLDVVNGQPPGAGALVRVSLRGGGTEPALVMITVPPANPARVGRRVLRSEDRLIALGGRLTVSATATGLALTGEIPCGS